MADIKDILRDDLQDDDNLPDNIHPADERSANKQVEAFEKDAEDGLQSFSNKKDIGILVHELNKNLAKQIQSKKGRREKHKIENQNLVVLATVIILLICILFYIVIKIQQKKELPKTQNRTALIKASL
ncbi:MAG: hypothetical protein JWN76_2911 [Chitinophagaceae bacterium]|nr:hypothetical protein [Chitinophagaceae bacterium]